MTYQSKEHEKTCSCPICNNGIREEWQYGAFEVKDGIWRIIAAEEWLYFEQYFRSSDKKIPDFLKVEPNAMGQPVLAYGVIIPQNDADVENWNKELEKYKNFALGTLHVDTLYFSAYEEYEIFTENMVYGTHIPCALLLYTSLDLAVERQYGFGHTAFVLYKDMHILDNILNRDFVFCLGGLEPDFKAEVQRDFPKVWKEYINKDRMMNIAKRLF